MPSKALEVNIAYSRVDVTVDKRYKILQEVMGEYHGVRERLQTFLEEICHPYKNWGFIVKEARGYALNYFHVLRTHPKGPEAARLYIDIFFRAIDSSRDGKLRINASDNLLSFIQKIIKDAGTDLFRFLPVLDYAFDRIRRYPKKTFALFVKSFYQLNRLGWSYFHAVPSESGFTAERIGHSGRSSNVSDSGPALRDGCVLKRLKIVCRTQHRVRTGQPDAAGRTTPENLSFDNLTELPVAVAKIPAICINPHPLVPNLQEKWSIEVRNHR